MKDEVAVISVAAQAILDELDAAQEEQDRDNVRSVRDGTRIARRVINASRALHGYIADLEQRAGIRQ